MANNRLKRHKRIRRKVSGSSLKPRVSVYRSNKHIQVQLINDDTNVTLVGLSTKSVEKGTHTKSQQSQLLGELFAKKVLALEDGKYKTVVFDRGGYKYHGRIKAIADSLRENGLVF
jgi:large subunit ribosomal protein L18